LGWSFSRIYPRIQREL